MAVITDLKKMTVEEVLELMNNVVGDVGSMAMEIAKSAVEAKAAGALSRSIDEFRKSNEKTSNRLIWLTSVIGLSAIVQAIYIVTLLTKK